MSGDDMAPILSQIGELPALPEVVVELMGALKQPTVNYNRVVRLIGKDPALAGRVLKLANSSFYGLSQRVGSIHDACLVLGASSIGHIITAISVKARFPEERGGVLDRKLLWRHALGTAVASGLLAQEAGIDAEQAFTAGLLHELGKLALDSYFTDRYVQVDAYKKASGCSLEHAERTVLGVDHRQVGARLAEHWHFPPPLVHAIGAFGSPDEGEPDELTDVVHIADIVVQALGIGDNGNPSLAPMAAGAWERLGLGWHRIRLLLPEIERQAEDDPFNA